MWRWPTLGFIAEQPGPQEGLADVEGHVALVRGGPAVEVVELGVVAGADLAHAQQALEHRARVAPPRAGVVVDRQARRLLDDRRPLARAPPLAQRVGQLRRVGPGDRLVAGEEGEDDAHRVHPQLLGEPGQAARVSAPSPWAGVSSSAGPPRTTLGRQRRDRDARVAGARLGERQGEQLGVHAGRDEAREPAPLLQAQGRDDGARLGGRADGADQGVGVLRRPERDRLAMR